MKKKMSTRSLAASKTNQTRKEKKALRDRLDSAYNTITSNVVVATHFNSKKEMEVCHSWYSRRTIAAILANYTRGTYDHLF